MHLHNVTFEYSIEGGDDLSEAGGRTGRGSGVMTIWRVSETTVTLSKLMLAIVAFQPQNTLHIKKGTWVFKNCGQKPAWNKKDP